MKYKLLLLNCTKKSEPNEVVFLSNFLEMMKLRYRKSIEYKTIDINSKSEFRKQLTNDWPNILHIAAHGDSKHFKSGRRGKETSICLKRGSISSQEIAKLPLKKLKLVMVSACFISYQDMANAFLDRGAEKFLAPKTKVDWVHAALFSAMFYKRYLYNRTSFEAAYDFTRKNTRLTKDFPEYWYNQ